MCIGCEENKEPVLERGVPVHTGGGPCEGVDVHRSVEQATAGGAGV